MKTLILFLVFALPVSLTAQIQTIPLYDGISPLSKKAIEKDEIGEGGRVTRVAVPELTVYHPEKASANQMAILICPWGGYALLAIQHEGHAIAQWYSERGYVAAVLKYRLPQEESVETSWEVPLRDARQGIRKLRENAQKWNINPKGIGVLGFSAGGHLASSVHGEEAQNGKLSSLPDFSILK